LTTQNKDARVHCAVLKLRTATTHHPAPTHHPHPTPRRTSTTARKHGDGRRFTAGRCRGDQTQRPDPSGPNSVPSTHPHPPARSHPAPPTHQRDGKRTSCTRTGRSGRRQLTDVPPSSTLPGTRAPGRALAPPTGPHPQRAGARAGREDAP